MVINAASLNLADVNAAISQAAAGDTVVLPAGTVTWASPLNANKNIHIQGAGMNTTVIKAGFSGTNSYLVNWTGPFEMSQLTLDGNLTACGLNIWGTGTGLKVHDIKITKCKLRGFNDWGLVYGVMYNCQFVDNFIDAGSIGAESAGWDAPFAYGDANNVFVEDCSFVHSTDVFRGQIFYCAQGGRMVFRHNTVDAFIDYDIMDNHGNVGVMPNRGTVGTEIYENSLVIKAGTYTSWRLMFHRGGQLLMFNNTITTPGGSTSIELSEEDAWKTAFGPIPRPITDKVTNTYFHNNLRNGVSIPIGFNHQPEDGQQIQLGRDYFMGMPSGYTPYAYPHPLRNASAPPVVTTCPDGPTSLAITTGQPVKVFFCAKASDNINGAKAYGLPASPVVVSNLTFSAPYGDGNVQVAGDLPAQPAGTYTVSIKTTKAGTTDESAASNNFTLIVTAAVIAPAPPGKFHMKKV